MKRTQNDIEPRGKTYCPDCGDTVTDEECPHWDYEGFV